MDPLKVRVTYRVPTADPYAFIEVTQESGGKPVTPQDIKENYDGLKAAFEVGEGIPDKEFNAVVDAMMCAESVKNGTEIWPRMSAEQQAICQAIKKSSKRINSKLKKAEEREQA